MREDYSDRRRRPGSRFPHDHARSRAYRWSEDGLGGVCDDHQTLCLAFAFWNGRDPILKERIFGLTGNEGNHGEDAKEYWWYLDSTPDALVDALALPLPARPSSPTRELVGREPPARPARPRVRAARHRRLRRRPLLGDHRRLRQGRRPTTSCIRLRGPQRRARRGDARTCCRRCGSATPGRGGIDDRRPTHRRRRTARSSPSTTTLGRMVLVGDGQPEPLFCENETNAARLWGVDGAAVPEGRHRRPRRPRRAPPSTPTARGTKAALCYRLTVAAGAATRDPPAPVARRRRRLDAGWDARSWPTGAPRPTSSTPRSHPPAPPPTRRWSCARPSPG